MKTSSLKLLVTLLLTGAICTAAQAQTGTQYHQPLSQHTPPGVAAGWMNAIRGYDQTWLQPLRIEVAGGGVVQVFSGSPAALGMEASPAIVAASAGHVYRLRISDMPSFPGLEIFPTVEVLDRLHPPQGREDEFAIPVVLTAADVRTALSGQLVTRVVYLEQPQLAQDLDPLRREIPQSVPPNVNALEEADRLGRPMAILRIGGRRPSASVPAAFFGTGGAVMMRPVADPISSDAGVVRVSGRRPSSSFEESEK